MACVCFCALQTSLSGALDTIAAAVKQLVCAEHVVSASLRAPSAVVQKCKLAGCKPSGCDIGDSLLSVIQALCRQYPPGYHQ
jgi:hypothetical protein